MPAAAAIPINKSRPQLTKRKWRSNANLTPTAAAAAINLRINSKCGPQLPPLLTLRHMIGPKIFDHRPLKPLMGFNFGLSQQQLMAQMNNHIA
uniref:Uncharacterized protein n=1 Tax=Romanomermis culicivorax TaxID=13658 RepID=A0A915J9S0_ROMCU